MGKKVLVLGATGAMGTYLTEKLAIAGHDITAVSLDNMSSDRKNLHYIQVKNAVSVEAAKELVDGKFFDAIVDFMSYNTISFRLISPIYLEHTDQYFYVSTCRVYANEEVPIKESSPRLIDVSTDPILMASDDYCIHKARGEYFLRGGKYNNWTIIRPSTTYSKKRCQLFTLERHHLLPYFYSDKKVILPGEAKDIPASLTWGGDVADMIMGLLFNPKAIGEDFNVTSSESRTWGEIAEYYHELYGLNYEWQDENAYQKFRDPNYDPETSFTSIWQLRYARFFNRTYDNAKILNATGLKQEGFKTLYEGLKLIRPTVLEKD